MGLLHEVRREFIAVPDDQKGQILFKWPDEDIRKFTRAIVEPDEMAVFVSQGQVMGTLDAGQHTLDAKEIPFLGMFVDWASQSDAFKAEIYFVGTREFANNKFGGRLDEVQDPNTGLVVTLRAFGEYSMKVSDPSKLILNLTGTVDVSKNENVTSWVAEQLLKVTRTTVTTQIVNGTWPILGLSVHSSEIEASVIPAATAQLDTYGIVISRLGNLDVNLDDDDNARLKKLAGDTAYTKLAGGFLQAAQAEALQGAGAGMAQGGASTEGVFLGAGLGLAGQMMPGAAPAAPAAAAPPAAVPAPAPVAPDAAAPPSAEAPAAPATAPVALTCPKCHAEVRPGAKFCDACGQALAAHCPKCNAEVRPGAKFCDECGQSLSPPAA